MRAFRPIALLLTVALAPAQQGATARGIQESDALRTVNAIDAAIVSGDREAFVEHFAPSHPKHFAQLLERMAPLLRGPLGIERSSRVERFWPCGPRGVAVVQTRTLFRHDDGPISFDEHLMLLFAPSADGTPRVALWTEAEPTALDHLMPRESAPVGLVLECPACNYVLDLEDMWLAVPNCRQRSGCFESFTLFAVDADLTATLSVHLGVSPQEPLKVLTALTVSQAGPRVDDSVSAVVGWLPVAYAKCDPPIEGLSGARCRYRDPDDHRATELRLLTFGRLAYLLTVEGPEAEMVAHATAVEALLEGFRLRDTKLVPERVCAHMVSGHGGGDLSDTGYANEQLGLHIAGPPGWPVRLDAGQYAVDVAWCCPADRGTLRAKGLRPPSGASAWTEDAADRVIAAALRSHGLEVVSDSDWQSRQKDAFRSERAIELRGPEHRPVLLRIALSDDLLLVLEGEVRDEAARGALLQAFDSTVRKP